MEALWTKEQVAELLAMTPGMVEKRTARGEIPCVPLSRRCKRYRPADIRALVGRCWVENHKAKTRVRVKSKSTRKIAP